MTRREKNQRRVSVIRLVYERYEPPRFVPRRARHARHVLDEHHPERLGQRAVVRRAERATAELVEREVRRAAARRNARNDQTSPERDGERRRRRRRVRRALIGLVWEPRSSLRLEPRARRRVGARVEVVRVVVRVTEDSSVVRFAPPRVVLEPPVIGLAANLHLFRAVAERRRERLEDVSRGAGAGGVQRVYRSVTGRDDDGAQRQELLEQAFQGHRRERVRDVELVEAQHREPAVARPRVAQHVARRAAKHGGVFVGSHGRVASVVREGLRVVVVVVVVRVTRCRVRRTASSTPVDAQPSLDAQPASAPHGGQDGSRVRRGVKEPAQTGGFRRVRCQLGRRFVVSGLSFSQPAQPGGVARLVPVHLLVQLKHGLVEVHASLVPHYRVVERGEERVHQSCFADADAAPQVQTARRARLGRGRRERAQRAPRGS
mmetsp:Transcript_5144/g.21850  ORF Transcript_5144/g.21850 Transcript_5144/m.21850 type:complete len:433 (-) Transcript_5144:146-1444(-)